MFKKTVISILIGMGSLAAQTFSGVINPFPEQRNPGILSDDTIKVLAVIADFQEDRDGSTFGNGKFGSIYSKDYGSTIIDPLPHDAAYFENHLTFLKNYFAKASSGRQNISFTVLPQIITVSKTMRNYSPQPKSDDLLPVAEFAKEVWKKADSVYNTFNFSNYDLFMIFHAGTGRDVSLPGSLGNERDLPSVYLGPAALQKIYPGFQGFPVSQNSFNIRNTAIIPETESRELSSIGGTALIELSINGLLAATTASYLQLPDLFDTGTGLSAIGRFGLMDGQAIFAYSGVFPPEPSAWEKIYLGWKTPSEASLLKNNYSLVPSLAAGLADTSILKINLSSSEYYLVENRQRDVNGDGAVLTYVSSGQTKTIRFEKDTTGFLSYAIDSLEGVITDVDEFDWALPGSGIVIWHIDENIIDAKLSENKINTDMNKRGVDVEEADGIQDIGVQFQTIFGDIVIGEGEQKDFWYSSNNSELYKNRFASDTRPATVTNTGAKSLITFSGFSDISNRMSFKLEFGDSIIKPVSVLNIPLDQGKYSLSHSDVPVYLINGNGNLNLYNEQGLLVSSLAGFTDFKPAVFNISDTLIIAGVKNSLNIYRFINGSGTLYSTGSLLTSQPVYVPESGKLLVGGRGGKIYSFSFTGSSVYSHDSAVFAGADEIISIAADNNFYSALGRTNDKYFYVDKSGNNFEIDGTAYQVLLTKNAAEDYVTVVNCTDRIIFISDGKINTVVPKDIPGNSYAALTDLKQDGNIYVVINDGNKLKALNLGGFSADNFPFADPSGIGFDNYVAAADFEGSKASEILTFTLDGRIYSVDGKTGKITSGFPLTTGSRLKAFPLLFNTISPTLLFNNNTTLLSAADSLNHLYTWSISSTPGKLIWSEEYGNNNNNSFIPAAEKTNFVNDFFPSGKVYNYPNPVYEGRTYIRYYVAENSSINIKIFDLAGALVEELNSQASGGADNETEWNVSGIQSGVYFARIEATAGSKKETNIIKIAVVK